MNELLEKLKSENKSELSNMKELLPETKALLEQYINKFVNLPPKMKLTNYNNIIYIELMKDAIEDDLPLTYEDIEDAFKDIQWDTYQENK